MPRTKYLINWYKGTHHRFPEIYAAKDFLKNANDLTRDEIEEIELDK
jgi:hypothetical protein